jgi:hypothetical protein
MVASLEVGYLFVEFSTAALGLSWGWRRIFCLRRRE